MPENDEHNLSVSIGDAAALAAMLCWKGSGTGPMPLQLSRLLPEHVSQVVALEQDCGLETWRDQDYCDMLCHDAGFHGLVVSAITDPLKPVSWIAAGAVKAGPRIIGFIAGRIVPPEAEIYKLAVRVEYRRRRIGSQMIEGFLKMAGERRVTDCYLEVRRSNVPAIALYSAYGFTCCQTRPMYYSNPAEDGLVMLRRGEKSQ